MNKLWVIIQREYLSRVTKKSFLLTTILVPLLIIGSYALMIFFAVGGAGTTDKRIAVVDESGLFIQQLPNSKSITFTYPKETIEEVKENLKKYNANGVLYIPELDIYKINDNIKYFSDERLGLSGKEYIREILADKIQNLRIEAKDLDKDILKDLRVSIQLPEVGIKEAKGDDTASEVLSVIGFVIGFGLYFVLIMFGTMVMKGVKEEKTNRIVEVIISSVKPFQLMLGKILGISFVGITQFVIWGVLFYGGQFLMLLILPQFNIDTTLINPGSMSAADAQDLEGIPEMIYALSNYEGYTKLAIAFFFYFIGGYLIYASLFSAVGAAVEDDTESQQLMFPVMMPIIFSIMVLITLFDDPNNSLAVWTSIFPLTSPIIMPARIPFDPPVWQIVASVISLIAGVLFFVWLSAKIYRTGILLYGKKINFKEIAKWLRY